MFLDRTLATLLTSRRCQILKTGSALTLNHRESYKLVFKIQRWLNCRAGTKHGSFTGIPTQPISNQQRQRYQATDPQRTLHAETQFSESANISKCA